MYNKAMQTDSPERFVNMMIEEYNADYYNWHAVKEAIEQDWEETTGGSELAVDNL
jgi:hypothetical protein